MQKEVPTNRADKSNKPGIRFSLRSLIVLVGLLSIVSAIVMGSYHRYTRASSIAAVVKSYGGDSDSEDVDCLASDLLVRFGFEPLKSITRVDFLGDKKNIDDHGLEIISNASDIETLIVYGNQFSESGLLHLHKLKKLKNVNLAGPQVTDAVILGIQKDHLTSFYAYGTSITDKGCASLVEATKMTHLYLGKSKITDESCRSIGKMNSLTYIEIGKNAITDEGVPYLYSLDKLETVDLVGTKVTKEAKKKLEQQIPGVVVH